MKQHEQLAIERDIDRWLRAVATSSVLGASPMSDWTLAWERSKERNGRLRSRVANRLAAPGVRVSLVADAASRVMVLGDPHLGTRLIDWNFVAWSRDRIDRAREDWKARRFPEIPSDRDEFVPCPDWQRATKGSP